MACSFYQLEVEADERINDVASLALLLLLAIRTNLVWKVLWYSAFTAGQVPGGLAERYAPGCISWMIEHRVYLTLKSL